jgi:hypothetical protein
MTKKKFLYPWLLSILMGCILSHNVNANEYYRKTFSYSADTLTDNQTLINGRIWKNYYYMIQGSQFLFSNNFLSGSVTIKAHSFSNIDLKYDVYNDEILMPLDSGKILQINKELVDSFSISFQDRTYHFIRLPEDSLSGISGYVNVIYKGKSAIEVKYIKKIDRSNIEGKVDNFYQLNRVFLVENGSIYQLKNKRDLYDILPFYKIRIRNYLKNNKLHIYRNQPDSFIPVIRFYDNIRQ